MLMISLRAYNQEIEQLIDNGLYDDAIAHSIHILVTFPKCIDSYRNLGKSLLEQKKYPEALDVFSRVLSAIPDDFISHVGLSIIFEDQNNLDLAIWHMEQAFDVQPSNLAIQDELKRLFGRRDGEQPTKIRLSKGALVRMYARGELFQQAITEILLILEEDSRRVDLEVILARMYYQSGSIDEAEATCTRILEKIPYCYEANRILQQIHIDKNDLEAAAINFNRLVSLDPYYKFRTSPFSDLEIPENKVVLEKLDYVPSTNVESQIPEWLEDIKSSSSSQTNESFSWLTDQSKQSEIPSPLNTDPFSINGQKNEETAENNIVQHDEEIPDWMKKAGWDS
ncbi:tetratricopeptide repeat protein, partial [bacterium]|nr:tetratricopeptide repeat protein [bacterium]